jgi:K+ transporter
VPKALLHNLKHNKVLHERNVLLTVETKAVPFVPASSRLVIDTIAGDFYRAPIRYGFMETPDIPLALMRSVDCVGGVAPTCVLPAGVVHRRYRLLDGRLWEEDHVGAT